MKIPRLILAAVLIAVTMSTSYAEESDGERVFREGVEFYKSGNYTAAKEKFEEALIVYGNDKAMTYIEIMGDEAPEDVYSGEMDSVNETPGIEQAVVERDLADSSAESRSAVREGIKLYELGDYENAKKKFEQALELNIDNDQAITNLLLVNKAIKKQEDDLLIAKRAENSLQDGIRLYESGKYELAKKTFEDVLNLVPEKANAKKYLELTNAKIEEARMAEQSKAEAEKIFNNGRDSYFDKNYDEARKKFIEALDVDPGNESARKYLERTNDKIERAREEKERKDKASALSSEAQTHFEAGEFREAKELSRKALELNPSDNEAGRIHKNAADELEKIEAARQRRVKANEMFEQGVRYYDSGEYLEAKNYLEKAILINGEDDKISRYLKMAEEEIAREAEIKRRRMSSESLTGEGMDLFREGNMKSAKAKFEEALDIYPENEKAISYLVKVNKEINRIERERELVKRSRSITEEGLEYFNRGEYEESEELFNEAIKIYTENQEAKKYLVEAQTKIKEEKERKERIRRSKEAYDQGLDNFIKKDYEAAKEKFKKALSIYGDNKDAGEYLELTLKEISRAREILERKTKAQLLSNEGIDYFERSLFEKAKEKFEAALDIDIENEDAVKYIIKTNAEIKRIEDEKIRKQESLTLYEKGRALLDKGDLYGAKDKFEKALRVYPGNKEAARYLEKAESDIKTEEERQAVIKKSEEAYIEGTGAYRDGKYEKAKTAFEQALRIYPENEKAEEYIHKTETRILEKAEEKRKMKRSNDLTTEGAMAIEDGKYEQAVKLLKEASQVFPANSKAKELMDHAENEIKKIKYRELRKKQAQEAYEKGLSYLKSSEYKMAEEKFDQAVKLNPGHIKASESLTKVKGIMRDIEEKKRLDMESASLLQEGIDHYARGDYRTAKEKFEEVLIVYNNKKALEYLEKVNAGIKEKEEEKERILTAQELFDKGVEYFNAGDFNKAEKSFREALTLYPESADIKEYIDKTDKALKKAQKLEEAKKASDRASRTGVSLYRKKDYEGAKKQFEKALDIYPGNDEAVSYMIKTEDEIKKIEMEEQRKKKTESLINEGKKLFNKREYHQAIKSFEKALVLDPGNKKADDLISDANEMIKKEEEEKRIMKDSSLLTQEGVDLYDKGKYKEALKKFEKAIKTYSGNKNAENYISKTKEQIEKLRQKALKKQRSLDLFESGRNYFNNKEYEKAKEALNKALKENSDNKEARKYIKLTEEKIKQEEERQKLILQSGKNYKEGLIAYREEQYVKAKEFFLKALKLNPENENAKPYVEMCEKEIELNKKKKSVIKKADEIFKAGMKHYEKGEYLKAKERFEDVLTTYPEHGPALSQLIKTNSKIRDQQEEALRIDKAKGLVAKGKKYYEKGDFLNALNEFEKALEMNANSAEAGEYKALALKGIEGQKKEKENKARSSEIYKKGLQSFTEGKYENAKTDFEKALELNPDNKNADKYLEKTKEKIIKEKEREKVVDKSKELYAQGAVLYEKGEYGRAKAVFEEALAVNPSNKQAKDYLNIANEAIRKKEKEKRMIIRSKRLFDEGKKLYDTGNYPKAEMRFKESLEAYPDNKEAQTGLDMIQEKKTQAKAEETEDLDEKKRIERSKELFSQGVKQYNTKNYDKAETIFRSAIDMHPLNRSAKEYLKSTLEKKEEELALKRKIKASEELYSQGKKYFADGEYAKAKEKYNEALKKYPGNEKAVTDLANAEEMIKKTAELSAEEKERQAILKSQDLLEKGIELYNNNEFAKAKVKFEKSLDAYLGNEKAMKYLAMAVEGLEKQSTEENRILDSQEAYEKGLEYLKAENYAKAKDKFEEAIAIYPGNRDAESDLYTLNKKMKDIENEKRNSEEAIRLYKKGIELYESRDFESSIEKFKASLAVKKDDNNSSEYLKKAESAQRKQKNSIDLYNQGMHYFVKEEFDKAKEKFEQAVKADPYNKNAVAYVKESERAIKEIETDKKELMASNELVEKGIKFLNANKLAEAKDSFDEALKLYPENMKARKYTEITKDKASTFLENGNVQMRSEETKSSLQEAKDSSEGLYREGMEYFRKNDFSNAKDRFEEALKVYPENKEASEYIKKTEEEAIKYIAAEKERQAETERKEKEAAVKRFISEGKKYYSKDEFEKAEKKFRSALQLEADNRYAKKYLSRTIDKIAKAEERKAELERSRKLYAEGVRLYENRSYSKALDKLKEARINFKNNGKTDEYINKVLDEIRREKDEKRMIEKSQKLYQRGVAYFKKGDYERAKDKFYDSLKIYPENKMAKDFLDKSDTMIAKNQAMSEAEQHTREMYSKGVYYFNRKEFGKARSSFNEVLSEDPENVKAKKYIKDIMSALEEQEKSEAKRLAAEEAYKKSVELLNKQKYTDALDEIEKALDMNPDSKRSINLHGKIKDAVKAEKIYNSGVEYYEKRNYKSAKRKFEEAQQLIPDNENYSAKIDEAARAIENKAEEDKRIKLSYKETEKAHDLYRKKDYQAAKTAYEKALKTYAGNEKAQRGLERAIETIKEKEEKEAQMVKSHEHFANGLKYFENAEYQKAKKDFDKALELYPSNKEAALYADRTDNAIKKAGALKDKIINAEKLRSEGEEYLKKDDYVKARAKFIKALHIYSQDKRSEELLKKTEAKIAAKQEKVNKEKRLKKNAWNVFGANEDGLQELLNNIPNSGLPEIKMSLQDCIDTALEKNLQLEIAENQIKLAKIRLWEAKRKLWPSVKGKWEESAGQVSGGYYEGRKILAEYNQPIFHGGELVYTMGQADINYKIVQNDYDRIKAGIILKVERAYYSLDKAIKALKLQELMYDKASEYNEVTEKSFKEGVVNKIEQLNVLSKYNQINFQYISSKEDVELAKLILQQSMNTEEDIEIVEVPEPKIHEITLENCYELAYANRPEMKINFLMTEYYLYEKKIMGAKGWPKIDFLGSWGYSIEDYIDEDRASNRPLHKFMPEWYAGVKVSVPVFGSTLNYSYTRESWQPVVSSFEHGSTAGTHTTSFDILNNIGHYADEQEAEVGFVRAQQEYDKVRSEINLDVKETFFKYKKAIIQMDVAKSKVEYQKKQLEFVEAKKDLNEAAASSVLEELIKYGEEEFSFLQAIADYYTAIKGLNKAVGIAGHFD